MSHIAIGSRCYPFFLNDSLIWRNKGLEPFSSFTSSFSVTYVANCKLYPTYMQYQEVQYVLCIVRVYWYTLGLLAQKGIIYFWLCLCRSLGEKLIKCRRTRPKSMQRKITVSDCQRRSHTPSSDCNRVYRWKDWERENTPEPANIRSTQNGFCLFVIRNVHSVQINFFPHTTTAHTYKTSDSHRSVMPFALWPE